MLPIGAFRLRRIERLRVYSCVMTWIVVVSVLLVALLVGILSRRYPSTTYAAFAVLAGVAACASAAPGTLGIILGMFAGSALIASAILQRGD